ncbi:MAG: VIT1/CCC1 transporter family protein [Chlorobium sp.]|uniref:VIT1/CCC1 transporter family protein n=1 Tax=Chlorobium sp. TaxID=1095 RepID=UPI001DFAAD1D|nr:VIT1/CCC1 transporter family protein [Chlorobium sp.]MBN1278824.1 VIT1/CCC1 transporter family protein [Chlorobiaceae bacterium]MCF8216531.1 VIT1/CCC1 transporter family protein [Chlorobium sp.]MCF8271436.1 VIT1/CCC1 transporter family protein [Chlorobium sp.]MCF8287808.1 VIT1/CCC1 transporter family protein [Chlorobium sp.]MCF8291347.1 VIT1/CCC1 transporter family protein [Chlorobium sp.]
MKQSGNFDARDAAVFQKNEITEHYIYKHLSGKVSGVKNRRILSQIADDEMRHYNIWKSYTRKDIAPSRIKVWFYTFVSMVFGFTFGIKLMENAEKTAHDVYSRIPGSFKEINGIIRDEEEHEQALITLLDEDRLKYTGSIVLGLNDALVELMGVLAGLTFALQNTSLVALTASITGFAAALSMASSEYLSTKSEPDGKSPLKAAFYTGVAYLLTVLALITPYLFFTDLYLSLGIAFAAAVCIIGFFNFYIAVAKGVPFKSRFFEMVGLSFTVAALSFAAGYGIRYAFGIEL